jgi:hypothetical protein
MSVHSLPLTGNAFGNESHHPPVAGMLGVAVSDKLVLLGFDQLEPEHLKRLYLQMILDGAKPATAHQVRRPVRTALGEAQRPGYVSRDVAALPKPPRVHIEEVEPYTVEEVQSILSAAAQGPNRAGWAIALALGLGQGEVLGLRWSDVDFESALLWVRKSRLRPIYEHGCGGGCGKYAGWCPKRVLVNGEDGDTKSRAGRRAVGPCLTYWPSCSASTNLSRFECGNTPAISGREVIGCSHLLLAAR